MKKTHDDETNTTPAHSNHPFTEYTPDGLCPLCGCGIEEWPTTVGFEGGDKLNGRVQSCPCCDWQSPILYEE